MNDNPIDMCDVKSYRYEQPSIDTGSSAHRALLPPYLEAGGAPGDTRAGNANTLSGGPPEANRLSRTDYIQPLRMALQARRCSSLSVKPLQCSRNAFSKDG